MTLDGTGNSKLTGNAGNDTFIIGGGDDTITDYGNGSDSISLTDYAMNDLTAINKSGSNVTLTFGEDKLQLQNVAVDAVTINGTAYTFSNDAAITSDNKGVILVNNSTVDLSTTYTDAQTIIANGGGKITAGSNDVTIGGTGKNSFIYNGGSMKIENYDASADVISLASSYSISDSLVSGSIVTLTITDGVTSGKMTIDAGTSDSILIKTSKGDEPLYLEQLDFAFNGDPDVATGVTVVADKGDFGVQGDKDDSGKGIGTGVDEYYQGLKEITATKENSMLIGNSNSNTFYVKGGGANVLTGGIGKDYFVFNSGGGIITDYGAGATKDSAKSVMAGSPTQVASSTSFAYDRTDPGTYKEGVDVLKVNGTLKQIAYEDKGNGNTKLNAVFSAYITYEDTNGDDYVIKLDNIYKAPTRYGSTPNYRTDDYVATRFQIWDTSSDGATLKERTLTSDLFTGDITSAETLLTDLMSTKALGATGNFFGSSNPLTGNSSNSNNAPVIVTGNKD